MPSEAPLLLCWADNCRSRTDSGRYILHATAGTGNRTLCGCAIQEVGDRFDSSNPPSCKRCLAIIAAAKRKNASARS